MFMTDRAAVLSDEDTAFLRDLGLAFLYVQSTERALGETLYLIFGLPDVATLEDIERLNAEAKQHTLGRLVNELRRRVTLDPRFESVLSEFVAQRNRFVHHFLEIDRSTTEGRTEANILIRSLISNGGVLQKTFLSFLLAFTKRVGIPFEPLGADEFLEDVLADANRVWGLVSGPMRSRVMPRELSRHLRGESE